MQNQLPESYPKQGNYPVRGEIKEPKRRKSGLHKGAQTNP